MPLVIVAALIVAFVVISRKSRNWMEEWLSREYESDVELSSFSVAIPFPRSRAYFSTHTEFSSSIAKDFKSMFYRAKKAVAAVMARKTPCEKSEWSAPLSMRRDLRTPGLGGNGNRSFMP
jgi:hypothetical protein